MVLRMNPPAAVVETSTVREFEVVRALQGALPVAEILWATDDPQELGQAASVSGFVTGVASPTGAPKTASGEESFAATSLPTLVQMVSSGLGVTFLPAMAVDAGLTDPASVAVRPISPGHASREIVVAWRAGSNRAAEGRLLAEVLRE